MTTQRFLWVAFLATVSACSVPKSPESEDTEHVTPGAPGTLTAINPSAPSLSAQYICNNTTRVPDVTGEDHCVGNAGPGFMSNQPHTWLNPDGTSGFLPDAWLCQAMKHDLSPQFDSTGKAICMEKSKRD